MHPTAHPASPVPAPIPRPQAWCKLAVLIADGKPAPEAIYFHPTAEILSVTVDTEPAFHAWAAAFGTDEDRRHHYHDHPDGEIRWSIHNRPASWYGYDVQLTAYLRDAPIVTADPDDLSRVREIAGHATHRSEDDLKADTP